MDISKAGEAGVISWCNSIRSNMARDPGRQFLGEQIQNSLDFLDGYLENVLAGPKTASVTELLKTPGRKKNAHAKTHSATAAGAKMKNIVSLSLEEENEFGQDTREPVNSFHKALPQAKGDSAPSVVIQPVSSERRAAQTTSMERAVAFADNAEDDAAKIEQQTVSPVRTSPPPQQTQIVHDEQVDMTEAANKELSIIAEDDESAERSRMSVQPLPLDAVHIANDALSEEPVDMELDESVHNDLTSTSANTFHSIPLDSPPRALPDHHHTEPLPPMPPAPHDDLHAMTVPLPVVSSLRNDTQLDELSVPIHEPSTSSSGQMLGHKPSLSQIGLSAPSPLHKSTRLGREPSVGTGLTSGPVTGGKRSSWLVKAREVKAMEGTAKRVSNAVGMGNKRKSGDMLGVLGGPSLIPGSKSARGADEERTSKFPKLTGSSEDLLLPKYKDKQADLEERPVEKTEVVEKTVVEPQMQTVRASSPHQPPIPQQIEDFTVPLRASDQSDEVLDRLKRTVEGLGARAGKSMGKSLGGNAAAALAEARAAAEARVAERNKVESADELVLSATTGSPLHSGKESSAVPADVPVVAAVSSTVELSADRRLSLSDLVSKSNKAQELPPPGRVIQPIPSSTNPGSSKPINTTANTSASTTPPNSPPHNPSVPPPIPAPVFSKPPIVFVAPPAAAPHSQTVRTNAAPGASRDFSFKLPTANPFSLPAAMTLGVPASLPSPPNRKERVPISAQTSKASLFSDAVFDREDDIPAWMPTTQDTDYSIQPSQSQPQARSSDIDDDDSWHVDEKFTSNQMWTPFGFASADKDDTWSTLPSRSTSQKGGDTGHVTHNFTKSFFPKNENEQAEHGAVEQSDGNTGVIPGAFNLGAATPAEMEEADIGDVAMEIDSEDGESDLNELAIVGKATISLVKPAQEPERARSQSQQSVASTASSSQSHVGFFGQASKLVSSVLGSKKSKPEPVKSLQLAAQAAKKQQEEIEKKAARLREMENRRQLALQRKAEEDKARALEEDRKIKEENERRKREREEHTDKRPIRGAIKKGDEDNMKKRKITVEAEKKPESKKPQSKDKKDNIPQPRTAKPGSSAAPGSVVKIGPPPKSALRQPGASMTAHDSKPSNAVDAKSAKTVKAVASSSNLKAAPKGKGKAPSKEDDLEQPVQVVQSQMANRVKAQMQATQVPPVPSESIELPDINSEYSDSDDEDRPRTFDPPEWAQSPELRQALQQQSTMNPDDIFGRIGPLRMEEIFRTRQSRFRARTSSANWTGTDQLTAEEEREYARRMGFR